MSKAGMRIPLAYYPPELIPGASDVYSAFWELSTERQVGFTAGQIPRSAIDNWLDRRGVIDAAEIQTFVHLIREMDEVYLAHDPKSSVPAVAAPVSLRQMFQSKG